MLIFGPTLLLAGVALSKSVRRENYALHERRGAPPPSWAHSHKLDSDTNLPLRFGLAQSNTHMMESFLMEVSHPESPSYGQHWSAEKVSKTFAPSLETIKAVTEWLVEEGFPRETIRLVAGKAWIAVNATVSKAEDLLDTEFHSYKHVDTGKEHIGCNTYSLPKHIQPHVDIVTPTVHFDVLRPTKPVRINKRGSAPVEGTGRSVGQPGAGNAPKTTGPVANISGIIQELENCNKAITPDCLRALYQIIYKPIATKKNSFGIVEFTPQAFLASDMDLFFNEFSPKQVGARPTLVSIDGGVVQTEQQSFNFNGESDLDLQYGMTLTNPQPVTLYQTGDLPQGASFNNLLNGLDASFCTFEGGNDPTQDGIYPDPLPGGFDEPETCGIAKPANVISVSYASDEADMTPFYSTRQCTEYGKLGLMGVTVLFSSGDDGVAGNGNRCLNPDGRQTRNGTLFNPLFPAVCPFVTAVGATQVNPNASVFARESACEQVIFSGGGFSNVFARPQYQQEVVAEYFANHPPTNVAGRFNNSNSRGFPDLSANGANYVIAIDGQFALVFGTSASAPVVGSIMTLINDARLAIGKSPIGFINPTIYSKNFRGAFNDIISGGNQGCGTPGFTSVPGWDPVTGLGTPNFPKLLARWLLLP